MQLRADELATAQRAFNARGSKVVRCEGCLLPTVNCMCASKPTPAGQCAVAFIMYKGEYYKPTNTGRLIADVIADNHDTEQNILDKAKEINKQIKKQQAEKDANISSEVGSAEEPLPLNDPFVGDASLGGASTVSVVTSDDEESREMSLYNFKLVAIMTGEYESYVSLINSTGEIVTLQMNEELSKGIKLVSLAPHQAVFEKGPDSYLIINFKNQIKETSEPF